MFSNDELKIKLNQENFKSEISKFYGCEKRILEKQRQRYLELLDLFVNEFSKSSDIRMFSTSGRTEIAGNHTDHQNGNVLCASVDLDIIAFARANSDNVIRLKSKGYKTMDIIDLSDLSPKESESFHSASLIRGISYEFKKLGFKIEGFDAYTSSNVPKGSGLSSSAAFEILVSTILNSLYNDSKVPPVTLAQISQNAENNFFGKPCGLMDQCGCSVGKVMTIDFKDPKEPIVNSLDVNFEDFGLSLVITNTGGSHSQLNDEYAAITTEMRSVASHFKCNVLRQVDENQFYKSLPKLRRTLSERAILRAMHYFEDNKRVLLQRQALEKKDIDAFLDLINKSGDSSWMLLQNIYTNKDITSQPVALGIAITKKFLGDKGGVRVHGGGFAGTIQAFIPKEMVFDYVKLMDSTFGRESANIIKIRNYPTSEVIIN